MVATNAKRSRGAQTKSAVDCLDCGKTKPLSNGVMASHQKGFGKGVHGLTQAAHLIARSLLRRTSARDDVYAYATWLARAG